MGPVREAAQAQADPGWWRASRQHRAAGAEQAPIRLRQQLPLTIEVEHEAWKKKEIATAGLV